MRLRRALESSASFASSAALWLSVWRIMCRKKFVFGFGAPDLDLYVMSILEVCVNIDVTTVHTFWG